ncbi:MAG: tetratricopeptide repeat protein [candidate division WOR-3 bacterium]|nr:MAG: tetratricopeptide repeat protein [candidate division WOR-3 bacterium]
MRQMKRGHYEKDEFQVVMQNIIKFIVRHRQTSVLIAAIVIIGIVAAVYLTSTSRETTNPEADLMHLQAMSLVNMGRFNEAENVLLDLTSQYANTRSGKIGIYYLGVIYYHTGRFTESIERFEKFLSVQKAHKLLERSAQFGAGCSAEGLKDYERAQKYYEKVISDDTSPFYKIALLSYGRVTGLIGEKEKAVETLKDLMEQDPPPDIAADAHFYIGMFSQ